MRFCRFALTIGLWAALASSVSADDQPGKAPSNEDINRLVQQLGENDLAIRRQAKKQLEAIGAPAVAVLKKAAESHSDPEIRSAAKAIVAAMESKSSGLVRTFTGHGNRVNGVAISGDGKRALSASWDSTLRHWNLETGELIGELIGEMHVPQVMLNSVALSPDGKRALTGGPIRFMC